jgi:hypothetical protein
METLGGFNRRRLSFVPTIELRRHALPHVDPVQSEMMLDRGGGGRQA